MKRKIAKVTVFALSAMLFTGVPTEGTEAAPTAGVSNYTSNLMTASSMPTAGVSLAFSECMLDSSEEAIMAAVQPDILEQNAPVVASEYADIAIAQVRSYVNVRSLPSEEGEILGKLYNNSAATVLGEEDGWYQVTSGSVTGYVKSEYVVVGDEALAKNVSNRIATVNVETLRVRKEATTESGILGLVPMSDDLIVIDESKEGWVGVSIEEGNGYVSAEYVSISTEYTYAESREEEEARLAKEKREREEAAAAAAAAAAEKKKNQSSNSSSSSSSSVRDDRTYADPSGSGGQAVADYACQFIGNPYVSGGTSLTNGADCSGFVMSVYAAFGVSLPHSSAALRSSGYGVDLSEIQPGDIVCYSGHVGIYVGNNTIVHASTPRDGIKLTSPVNYHKILAVRRIF